MTYDVNSLRVLKFENAVVLWYPGELVLGPPPPPHSSNSNSLLSSLTSWGPDAPGSGSSSLLFYLFSPLLPTFSTMYAHWRKIRKRRRVRKETMKVTRNLTTQRKWSLPMMWTWKDGHNILLGGEIKNTQCMHADTHTYSVFILMENIWHSIVLSAFCWLDSMMWASFPVNKFVSTDHFNG